MKEILRSTPFSQRTNRYATKTGPRPHEAAVTNAGQKEKLETEISEE